MGKESKKTASYTKGSSRGSNSSKKTIRTAPTTATSATKKSSKSSKERSQDSDSTSRRHISSSTSSSKTRQKPNKSNSTSTGNSRTNASGSSSPSRAKAAGSAPSSSAQRKEGGRRVLSDEESNQDESEVEEESDGEDPDRQLGLRPTLRVVSGATIRKSWKPVNVKTRTHVQSLVAGLFPAVITQSRGEKRKIEMQAGLNRLMQKLNDTLSELQVPQAQARVNYAQLSARNRELEAMLVPDLERIRDLELRLEQEQILAAQDEEALNDFKETKKAVDTRTKDLQRKHLHRQLKDDNLSDTIDSLSHTKGDYGHLSVTDQRLMNLMPLSRHENFTRSGVRESFYNPDQDVSINKISKRLGSRLSAIERHSEGLDPLMQLVAAARDKVADLSRITPVTSPLNATSNRSTPTTHPRSYL
ncbi:hypothetical protein BGZ96_009668 [Linnemannia gamsii]|uniref:Uncharacterized protein n=1 Tax=Linnemannia gamsii TaxID=64522 RepID=A0ABQ7JVP5_9FUNG|nr:hypothetical protein BGZ96_009668 [Linnemannia gamsii]